MVRRSGWSKVGGPNSTTPCLLIVDRVLRVSQVENDAAVRALFCVLASIPEFSKKGQRGREKTHSTTTGLAEDALKVNGAVEVEGAVLQDVDPVSLEVGSRVENGDLEGHSCQRRRQGKNKEKETNMGQSLTSPAWTKYPVTSRFFLSGDSLR